METYQLNKDIQIFCLVVPGFPNGIQAAFDELEKAVPAAIPRSYYAVSWLDEQHKVVYNAAVATDNWDGSKFGYETYAIPRGRYLSVVIKEWRSHLQSIGETFKAMMKDPRADCTFPCVEWYKDDEEMSCWVRMK